MRKKLIVVLVVVALMMTAGLAQAAGRVVVYTPESEDVLSLIIPLFEQETGITVELIAAGTGELVRRVQTEHQNPYADVFLGGDDSTLSPIMHLLAEYVSPQDEFMLDNAKNPNGFFSYWTSDGSMIIVNTELEKKMGITINGYADLLQPELKGNIMHGDSTASSSSFGHLCNMLLAMGDGVDFFHEDAWDYVDKFIANLDGKIASSSGIVHRSVADGEYVVGLTWEDPAAAWLRDGAPVRLVYQEEGVVFRNVPMVKIKGGPNPENAKIFIDFVLSDAVQSRLGTEFTARPLRKGVTLGDHMYPMEKMNLIYESAEETMIHRDEIIRRYREILMKY